MNKKIPNNYSLIDLHTHSCYSDGMLTPIQLVNLAILRNIGTLSITDHNTLEGNYAIKNSIKNDKLIKIIPGIELTAKCNIGRMHILGYNMDIYDESLNKKLEELKNKSIYYAIALLYVLKADYNINFKTEDIKYIFSTKHNVDKSTIADLCVKYGYANNYNHAFKEYLIDASKKILTNNRTLDYKLEYKECIDLITSSGGIPVLAHPYTLKRSDSDLLKLLKEMVDSGLEGIEVYHSSHSNNQRKLYLQMAKKLKLLVSGGSDFHGKISTPKIELGTGKRSNLKIKSLTILDKINNKL